MTQRSKNILVALVLAGVAMAIYFGFIIRIAIR